MPALNNRIVIEVARGIKAFLNVNAGFTRGAPPWVQEREELQKARSAIAQQDQQIQNLQGWLAKKDQNISRVRERLAAREHEVAELESSVAEKEAETGRPPIFFVVGRPRSGTNWLMRTLNAHPEVRCQGEGRFFGREWRQDQLKDMQTSEHIRYKTQPASLYNAIAESEYLRLWVERSVWTRSEDAEQHLNELTREAIYHFLSKSLAGTGKKTVGDKTPLNGRHVLGEIGKLCPEAKAVHIIRDGRDVSISQLHHKWNRATDEGGLHDLTDEELDKRDRYREDPQDFLKGGQSIFSERQLREHASGWAAKIGTARDEGPSELEENYTEVHYERLLESPVEEFGRVFSFLGATEDEKTVARCVNATSFEKRSGGRERGEEDTRSGARKGIAGDWKNVFTERDKEIFKEEAGELLLELGYEDSNDW